MTTRERTAPTRVHVRQLTNDAWRAVANHFEIFDGDITLLQSYRTIIAKRTGVGRLVLDEDYYNWIRS